MRAVESWPEWSGILRDWPERDTWRFFRHFEAIFGRIGRCYRPGGETKNASDTTLREKISTRSEGPRPLPRAKFFSTLVGQLASPDLGICDTAPGVASAGFGGEKEQPERREEALLPAKQTFHDGATDAISFEISDRNGNVLGTVDFTGPLQDHQRVWTVNETGGACFQGRIPPQATPTQSQALNQWHQRGTGSPCSEADKT